ncbi:hypothetical protein JB92DRAFT_2870900 [Gautieria morchelliformis]|nr:hypothetical protein JB92DRAFT_2870900 [Gautieria morchelliformis]
MWGSFPPIQEGFCQQGLPSILGVADFVYDRPLSLLLSTLQAGSQGRLVVDSVVNIGPHYARTLREWRRRFLERFSSVIVPALMKEGQKEIEVFKRKWICECHYSAACYCEVGFTTRTLGDHIVTTREGNTAYGCNVYD